MGARKTFLLVGSFADSLLNFRGALLDDLLEKGLEVHAAAPGLCKTHPICRQLEDKGIRAHDLSMQRAGINPIADFVTACQLLRLIREVRPDYFMGYAIKPVIYGSLVAWAFQVPHRFALVTGLGYTFQDDPEAGLRSRIVRKIARCLYALALGRTYKVFFQNPDDERLFRDLGIIGKKVRSCVVNGSGVDIQKYAVAPLPSTPRFLLIARLLRSKGVCEYVKAAIVVRRAAPEVKFALAGWIDENPDSISQQELDEWQKSGEITYLGCLDDVRPALAACSIYVLPSYREGTPRTVLEAMAMGRPVITTDAPGCRETVREGENGFLVPVQSVDELVDAMLRFVRDPGLAARMGAQSRTMAEDRYDVHKVNRMMMAEMGLGAQ